MPDGSLSGFATSSPNAAEYGSTAPGNPAETSAARGQFPLNFEEPPYRQNGPAIPAGNHITEPPNPGRFTSRVGSQPLCRTFGGLSHGEATGRQLATFPARRSGQASTLVNALDPGSGRYISRKSIA